MQEVPHSVRRCSYSFSAWTYSQSERHLALTGHELLFISLHFMVQNDYGCMMNILIKL